MILFLKGRWSAQWQEVPYAILNDDDFRDFIFELNLMMIAGSMSGISHLPWIFLAGFIFNLE